MQIIYVKKFYLYPKNENYKRNIMLISILKNKVHVITTRTTN